MGSRFELVLCGDDPVRLRAAGEEALAEIARLHDQLSLYRPESDLSRLNARAAEGPVPVEPRLYALLRRAAELHRATGGAFDPTVAPLMACWGFVHDTGRLPEAQALAEARRSTGMHLVRFNDAARTVAFDRPGVKIDLGGIGKGYAVDEAVLLLREAGVRSAFLHGGTSTIYGLGRAGDGSRWRVALPRPGASAEDADHLDVVELEDEALSVSAVWGKAFEADGVVYGHVLDPRTGRPVHGALLAAVALADGTAADALSTALLVLGRETAAVEAALPRPIRFWQAFSGADVRRANIA